MGLAGIRFLPWLTAAALVCARGADGADVDPARRLRDDARSRERQERFAPPLSLARQATPELDADPAARRIRIEVVPGRVAAWRLDGAPMPEGLRRAFPDNDAGVLALSDLEQGVHQINRLRLHQAEIKVLPGQTPGTSIVDLHLARREPWRIELGADNLGAEATGSARARAGLALDNILGQLESFQLTGVHARASDALLAALTVPQGYNLYSLTGSASRYAQKAAGLTQTGGSRVWSVAWNRMLARSAAGSTAFDLALSHSRADRRLEGVPLTPERLTVLRAALGRAGALAGLHPAYVEAAMAQGLAILGAQRDAPDITRTDAHAQFFKAELHGRLTVKAGSATDYVIQFDAQHAARSLYVSEQFRLGGMGTVRGFAEGAITGDRGYLVRHELRRVPWAVADSRIGPVLFLDHGETALVGASARRLVGAGLGLRLAFRQGAAELMAASAVSRPADLSERGLRFHFTLGIEL
ncbi:MAG: ShlB/FhaC/HecB family hemolysin secretion/activation protein [Pseudomonadota bacterium]|jgi:hemolysin activation/secretion protein